MKTFTLRGKNKITLSKENIRIVKGTEVEIQEDRFTEIYNSLGNTFDNYFEVIKIAKAKRYV